MPGTNKLLSILIIEDNLGDFVLVEDFLLDQYKNISIVHCTNYKDAVTLLQNNRELYSIILLDLHLPDLAGIALIEGILKSSHAVPVIVLTGYADLNIAKKGLEIGVYDFLIKDEINSNLLQKSIDYAFSRKSYIEQIEGERHNYKNLFNLSPQPMWLLHSETFQILDINEAAISKYGYSFEESSTMSFMELHPKKESKFIYEGLSSNSEESLNNQFTHLKKDGQKINVELSIKKIDTTSGRKDIIVQSTDITDIITHINTIEQQNEKLKSIAWTQSHVVRAPISRILGIIDFIEDHKESFDDLLFWLEQLKNSTNEMDDIVRKIVKETQGIQDVKKE